MYKTSEMQGFTLVKIFQRLAKRNFIFTRAQKNDELIDCTSYRRNSKYGISRQTVIRNSICDVYI